MQLPIRAHQHIEETNSFKLFSQVISDEWIVREITERDYGIDCYLEICENGFVTGKMIMIQLKSSDTIKMRREGTFVSYNGLEPASFNYWNNMLVPVVFVYIDLDKATIFYSNVKEYIRENFSKFISENLKTLRIPVSNVLTNKNACIFLSEIYTKESARPFLELKISNFVLSLRSNIDFMAEHICRDCFLGLGEEDSDDFRLITLYEELEVLAKYYNIDWQLKPLYYYIEQGRKVFGDYYLLYEKQASYIVSLLIPLSIEIAMNINNQVLNKEPEYWENKNTSLYNLIWRGDIERIIQEYKSLVDLCKVYQEE